MDVDQFQYGRGVIVDHNQIQMNQMRRPKSTGGTKGENRFGVVPGAPYVVDNPNLFTGGKKKPNFFLVEGAHGQAAPGPGPGDNADYALLNQMTSHSHSQPSPPLSRFEHAF